MLDFPHLGGETAAEAPQEVAERRPIVAELKRGFALIGQYLWFREFLVGRTLCLTIELAIPFYTIYVVTLNDPTAKNIAEFVFAVSFGMLLAGPVWGRLQHSHCHLVIALGAWLMALAMEVTGLWGG